MDILVLALFCGALLLCVGLDLSILLALGAGLVLFLLYGRRRGFGWGELLNMALSGVKTVRNILITFLLIGVLTALWRDAGTISAIVCYASAILRPSLFLLMAFLLNCLVSVLTGTSFGTAATMGVICATMASAMGISPVLLGGAVLSGAYFGDRCSPVSTSALLVAEVTKTNIFRNIKGMIHTAGVPFLLTCGLYWALGCAAGGAGQVPDLKAVFGRAFSLHWITLLPAAVILVLSLLRVSVKKAMAASILTALPICLLVQHTDPAELPGIILRGYVSADPEVAAMLNGGGVLSMVRVACIVCLASSYSGMFQKTGLLDRARQGIDQIARRTNAYTAMVVTSVVGGMIACNQTLTIMLTHQLCGHAEEDREQLALHLENSAVVIAPLVPWSIAGGVPLASVGAPTSSLLFACFLYLLPLWQLAVEALASRKGRMRTDTAHRRP